jgi:hypothetical protein
MSVDEGTEGGLGAGPELMGRETRGLSRGLIVEVDGVAKGKGPEVPMIVLGPTKGGKDHDSSTGPNGVFDCIFCDSVMMMTANPTVFDALALGYQLRGEFLGGIDPIVRAVVTDLDSDGGGFTFEGQLGLYGFRTSETNLMNHSEFPTGGVAEDGTATVLLARDVVTPG